MRTLKSRFLALASIVAGIWAVYLYQSVRMPPPITRFTQQRQHSGGSHNVSVVEPPRKQRNYNFTLGVCAIVADFEAYLIEWVDFHLIAMGIESIYLYDNSDSFDLEMWHNNTRSHPVYRRVEVTHWPRRNHLQHRNHGRLKSAFPQAAAYTDCVSRYGKSPDVKIPNVGKRRTLKITEGHDYLAFIDGDEFLVPRGQHDSVHSVIEEYLQPYGGALSVNWMIYGTANKTVYSPVPVTKRFQYREDVDAHFMIKTIVKSSDYSSCISPHSMKLKLGARLRTTLYPGALKNKTRFSRNSTDHAKPSHPLLLHHYRYTSVKEYLYKRCVRGQILTRNNRRACNRSTGQLKTAEELAETKQPSHLAHSVGTVFDDSAWKILSLRVPKYEIYDNAEWADYN